MTAHRPDTDAPFVIDEAEILTAVQGALRAVLVAAPWPRALLETATAVLSDPARALGGRLTPWTLFPLCCCAATCGDWRPALPAAAAAELYATASDLFDDLEDGDLSGPATRYSIPILINLATGLLVLVHRVLLPAESKRFVHPGAYRRAQDAFWEGAAVGVGGQHLDLVAAGATPLTTEECLDIARRKGGALVAACCRAGAAFGTDDLALIERCHLLGQAIGLMGQLDNDMHDAGDMAGKSDLARQAQTIPIALARSDATHGEPDAVRQGVWQGGIQLAYALMHAERARAQERLEAVAASCPDPAGARAVLALLLRPRGQTPNDEPS